MRSNLELVIQDSDVMCKILPTTLKGQHEPDITTKSQALSWVLITCVLNLCHGSAPVYPSRRAQHNSLMLLNQKRIHQDVFEEVQQRN